MDISGTRAISGNRDIRGITDNIRDIRGTRDMQLLGLLGILGWILRILGVLEIFGFLELAIRPCCRAKKHSALIVFS
jgi:hypothetical protein